MLQTNYCKQVMFQKPKSDLISEKYFIVPDQYRYFVYSSIIAVRQNQNKLLLLRLLIRFMLTHIHIRLHIQIHVSLSELLKSFVGQFSYLLINYDKYQ